MKDLTASLPTAVTTSTIIPARSVLEIARASVNRHSNSFTRMNDVWQWKNILNRSDWLALVGENWDCCDKTFRHYKRLRRTLKTTGPLREMMTPEENAGYDALPKEVTVYRGCGEWNRIGMSWSLDREMANSFPHRARFAARHPFLLTATVSKNKVLAIKLDRGEDEVITFSAKLVSSEPSIAPTAEWWVMSSKAGQERLDEYFRKQSSS
jgi:hypothetical protein